MKQQVVRAVFVGAMVIAMVVGLGVNAEADPYEQLADGRYRYTQADMSMGVIDSQGNRSTYFKAQQFNTANTTEVIVSPKLVDLLNTISVTVNKPVTIVSGYRPSDSDSAHAYGLAADIYYEDSSSYSLSKLLYEKGFRGVGTYYNNDWSSTNTAHGDVRGLHDNCGDYSSGGTYSSQASWTGWDSTSGTEVRDWDYTAKPGHFTWDSNGQPYPGGGTGMYPEPSSLLALGSGLAGIGGVFFRRRRR